MIYETSSEYYFRLHHIRPRFKGDIESVLLYLATEISKIGLAETDAFNNILNVAIRNYTGNATRDIKTINNWRTEISALFGFTIEHLNNTTSASRRAIELSDKQDLVEMFKKFLYTFQYPGGHIKSHEV